MNHFDYMAPVEVFNNHFAGFSDHWHDEFKKKNIWTKLFFPNFQNHVSDDVTATLESHPPGLLLPLKSNTQIKVDIGSSLLHYVQIINDISK